MSQEQADLLIESIEALKNKDFNIYFYLMDTKGNATAAVSNIYEHASILKDLGYNAKILHNEVDYVGVSNWLGEEYMELEHMSIHPESKSERPTIKPQDFIIIPEIFSNVMEKLARVNCKKIVLSQSYEYIFEILNYGLTWGNYGINDVITTTEQQAKYIKAHFPSIKTTVIPPMISKEFNTDYEEPKKPSIAIVSRDQKEAIKLIKSFYLQYPMFKWVPMSDLRGLTREEFASRLKESAALVWLDEISSFGTAPLEAIECGTPVIGKVPNMIPEWMAEFNENNVTQLKNNGIWVQNKLDLPHVISRYLQVWLEDEFDSTEDLNKLFPSMEETKGQYSKEKLVDNISNTYSSFVENRIKELENTKLIMNAQ